MNGQEIIEMAIQAGARQMISSLTHPKGPVTALKFDIDSVSLETFAKLVAAKEREACAKVADYYASGMDRNYSKIIADAIRARP
jgi:hypothetical protein